MTETLTGRSILRSLIQPSAQSRTAANTTSFSPGFVLPGLEILQAQDPPSFLGDLFPCCTTLQVRKPFLTSSLSLPREKKK